MPAEIAVWNLSYSSPPAPAFVQQTWTSSCSSLKLSTTSSMFGYQAHSVTTGRSSFVILFVQLVASLPPFVSPPGEQAARAAASRSVLLRQR